MAKKIHLLGSQWRRAALLLALAWGGGGGGADLHAATHEPGPITPPKPLREFRAVWVATVGNIDWPSRRDLTSAQQRAELLALLDRAAQLKLNALILQVRPACDALYASPLEPWSEYLTGAMGKRPEPYYDPLAFAVEAAHQRGLELHAWFNPYRARHPSAKSPPSANHISQRRPQLVKQYGKYLWLDPGENEVQDYSLSVLLDVVKRYDVDGVHLDDYFYPYKEKDAAGADLDFPDGPSWERYGRKSRLSRDDWRRRNVNEFILRAYQAIKAEKPWVKFGVSPFGIWRPGYPPPVGGYDAYAKLYADSRQWLAKGWVDYFCPQLYWRIDSREQSFPVLLKWWQEQNSRGRLLAPGLNSSSVGHPWPPEEIINQIRLARRLPGVGGHVHWNMTSLMGRSGLAEALAHEVYGQPALPPAAVWLTARPQAAKPNVAWRAAQANSPAQPVWSSSSAGSVARWLVQSRRGVEWSTELLPATVTRRAWPGAGPDLVAVSAVDRYGNLSAPAVLRAVERKPAGR
jgi:uncharacterized lipoprotein YddW (UPF0748 family)